MAQKINPLGFRLGTTQSHHSIWFAKPKDYSANLQEDEKIRDYIKNYVQKNINISSIVEGITRIEIQKGIEVTQIKIYTASSKLGNQNQSREKKELQRNEIQEFQRNLRKEFYCVNRKLNLTITRLRQPYRNPKILAEFISNQVTNRVSFRKAMKKAIELNEKTNNEKTNNEKTNIKGIRVQIAGRLDGKDIARVESIQKGRLPLQTIRAKIDYCSYSFQTISGVLGIKIWIFIDE
uniref:Small ribosomal subunit protein uS3c n=1 Tax=Platycodon grandiflorus TaxID=94286 RepID=A0A240FG74_PLAGD|nr:ribosomal protein S3 [Platycodon grandiflorus]YP_009414800.1 ribosomal protein S3 [Platycodon grandiflorus]ARR27772.1 ribosomal protein S3 [Platycodon grandiflorus]ARR27791.1 ribosomal protein S3 [Platycodon grandiflorus]UBK12171.1 ribosomal protein S3 [Platycodon grandiflorus]UBK12204.1 ribosomal protein S3 [Platycodon grandiflorus]UXO94469.1 ribosomal protein S3 [Platycodon grandiflorus]